MGARPFTTGARIAEDEKSVVAVTVTDEDQAVLAQEIRSTWPNLARRGYTDRQLTQSFLVGGEALFAVAFWAYCGNILYYDTIIHGLGAPPADFVGLNSTSCLATGIVGLSGLLGSQPQVRLPERAGAEQGAFLDRMAAGGIAVRATHYPRNTSRAKATENVPVYLPFVLSDGDYHNVHMAARETLKFDLQPAFMADISTLRILALFDLRIAHNGRSAPLLDGKGSNVSVLAHAAARLVAKIGAQFGRAALTDIPFAEWLVAEKVELLASLKEPAHMNLFNWNLLRSFVLGLQRTTGYLTKGRGTPYWEAKMSVGLGKGKIQRCQLHLPLPPPPTAIKVGGKQKDAQSCPLRLGGNGADIFCAWERKDGTMMPWKKVVFTSRRKKHALTNSQLANVTAVLAGKLGDVDIGSEEDESEDGEGKGMTPGENEEDYGVERVAAAVAEEEESEDRAGPTQIGEDEALARAHQEEEYAGLQEEAEQAASLEEEDDGKESPPGPIHTLLRGRCLFQQQWPAEPARTEQQ